MKPRLRHSFARLWRPAIVVLVVGLALVAPAAAGPTTTVVTVEPTAGTNAYDPERVRLEIGADPANVRWQWGPGGAGASIEHSVVQDQTLFKSGPPAQGDTLTSRFSAGTFNYHCDVHDEMTGRVAAEPTHFINDGARVFRITWAHPYSNTGAVYDVRFRAGAGDWQTWKTDTAEASAVFGAGGQPVNVVCDRFYRFQARSQRAGRPFRHSDWSPTHSVLACD